MRHCRGARLPDAHQVHLGFGDMEGRFEQSVVSGRDPTGEFMNFLTERRVGKHGHRKPMP